MNIPWPKSNIDFNKINDGIIINLKNKENLEEEFYDYAQMFEKSGSIIAEHVLNSSEISKLDTYFFSIAYLYRHSIELIMKSIGFKYIIKEEERRTFVKDTFHNLSKILQTINPHIKKQLKNNEYIYKWITNYFNDINEIDKESDAFRYPFGMSVNTTSTLFGKVKSFSINPVFNERMDIDLKLFICKLKIVFKILNSIYLNKSLSSFDLKKFNPIFIEEGGSYYNKSIVGEMYSRAKYYPYIKAYKESAKHLYKKIYKHSDLKNILFIPMCYLYRNTIELSLKQIYFEECSSPFQETIKNMKKKKHSILGLWNLIKNEIEYHADAPKEDKTIKNVEQYIKELHNYDGASDKFRYPTNKYLNIHFKKNKNLDIKNVNNFFNELESFLDSVDMMMSAHNEAEAEMRSEMDCSYEY